jgi:hypothetical protein
MEEPRQHPGLGAEAASRVGAREHIVPDHLDRHLAVETRVLGAIDDPHAAGSELRDDAIATQGLLDDVTSGAA